MMDDPVASDDSPLRPPEATATPDSPVKRGERGGLSDERDGPSGAANAGAEVEIWVGRTHWKHYAGRLFAWGVGNIAFAVAVIWIMVRFKQYGSTVAFGIISGGFTISSLLVVGRIVLRILGHRYRVTNQRLFIERGILSQTVDQTELIRVDDVRLHKTFSDRLFGIGSVSVVSTDATDKQILLEGILDPDKVSEAIRANMRILRQKSLFIESL